MSSDRLQRPPPRERTFAQVFPWRNIRRAVMLALLIVAIVVIKRSTGSFLSRVMDLWAPAPPTRGSGPKPSSSDDSRDRRIRLGPGLAPGPVREPGRTPPARSRDE